MDHDILYDKPERRPLPHVGQRIVKTAIAVFICLMIYYLRGYTGQSMPTESMITAIICMQPYVRDSRAYAWNRLTGTLVGAVMFGFSIKDNNAVGKVAALKTFATGAIVVSVSGILHTVI